MSKEFVREWLIEGGFMGQEGQEVPEMTDAFVNSVSERYIQLYEQVTGKAFVRPEEADTVDRIQHNIATWRPKH